MRAACLSAGVCSRLLPHTLEQHKSMLMVGGSRFVDIQINNLFAAGIDRISFIIGHGASNLKDHIQKNHVNRATQFVYNDKYFAMNLDLSALLALDVEEGPVLYCEGDTLVSASLSRRIMADSADVVLAFDPSVPTLLADTHVIMRDGEVSRLSFREHTQTPVTPEGSAGEFVCMVKLSDEARRFVVERLRPLNFTGPMQLYEIFNELFSRFSTCGVNVDGEPWVEIDTWEDYQRAVRLVTEERCF